MGEELIAFLLNAICPTIPKTKKIAIIIYHILCDFDLKPLILLAILVDRSFNGD
jgi:hypothetical protein